jgi:hypothetical protein
MGPRADGGWCRSISAAADFTMQNNPDARPNFEQLRLS